MRQNAFAAGAMRRTPLKSSQRFFIRHGRI